MRIGLTGGGSSTERIIQQAQQAEADGFSALWYASEVCGDPLVAMALAGRKTTTIELGTAVLQTYPCHPLLQARRIAAVVDAMGRPGFTVGIGPSHEPLIRGVFGLSYDHPGRSTEEYLQILTTLLRGEDAQFDGHDWSAHTRGREVRARTTGSGARGRAGPAAAAHRRTARRRSGVVDGASAGDRRPRGAQAARRGRGRRQAQPSCGGGATGGRTRRRSRCTRSGGRNLDHVFGHGQLSTHPAGRGRHRPRRRRGRRRRSLRPCAAARS